jgi:hypothetical protein
MESEITLNNDFIQVLLKMGKEIGNKKIET